MARRRTDNGGLSPWEPIAVHGGQAVIKSRRIDLDEVVQYFHELEDPRSEVNRKHPLVSVVVIAVLAVLAGAGGPTAIAKWATIKAEFLLKLLELPYGIPCKDVFRRVLMSLHPGAFQSCFVKWLECLRAEATQGGFAGGRRGTGA
jgi:hypothetical protein